MSELLPNSHRAVRTGAVEVLIGRRNTVYFQKSCIIIAVSRVPRVDQRSKIMAYSM